MFIRKVEIYKVVQGRKNNQANEMRQGLEGKHPSVYQDILGAGAPEIEWSCPKATHCIGDLF